MRKTLKSNLCIAASVLALSLGMGAPAFAQETAPTLQALQDQINTLQKQLAQLQAAQTKSAKEATAKEAKATKATVATTSNAVTVDEKGAFKLPNGTTIKLGGYVKLDVLHDLSERPALLSSADSAGSDYPIFSQIPTSADTNVYGRRKGSTRIDARQTRLVVASSTPTSYGPFETYIETDFFGNSPAYSALATNSYGLRLRRAYGTFYGFTVGQNWTTFLDVAAVPETLDITGPAGAASIRQAQIRYTYDFGNGHSLTAAIENPETDVTTTANSMASTVINHYPDVIGVWKYQSDWGHINARALVRNLAVKNNPGSAVVEDNKWGYGVAASGKWKPFLGEKEAYAKDNLLLSVGGGTGIGRYIAEAAGLAGILTASNDIDLLTTWGGYAGYQHFWTDALRSSVAYGHSQTDQNALMAAAAQKSADSVHANLIWSPIPSMDVGFEYIWGHRTVHNDAKGYMNRLQASATYRF